MTQRETVLAMLRHAGSRGVTGVEFFAANLPRAAARVCELRDRGQEIRSVPYTTGTGVRTVRNEWVRNLKRQCDAVGVPFFFKKWGSDIFNRTMIVNSPQNGAYVKSIDNDGEIDGKICREFPNG